jgi:hypothetical protein
MRLTLPLIAAVLSTVLTACAAPVAPAVQTAAATPAAQACMTAANVADVLKGQGLTAVTLTAEQNAAWRAYDNAHSQDPDPAGFTYVIGVGDGSGAVLVGFKPDGCFAYYVPVPRQIVASVIGAEA